jgi:hypothetical protein
MTQSSVLAYCYYFILAKTVDFLKFKEESKQCLSVVLIYSQFSNYSTIW